MKLYTKLDYIKLDQLNTNIWPTFELVNTNWFIDNIFLNIKIQPRLLKLGYIILFVKWLTKLCLVTCVIGNTHSETQPLIEQFNQSNLICCFTKEWPSINN